MTITETTNATTDPTPNTNHSNPENTNPAFNSFSKLAPSIVGIAKKNENSAATYLDAPSRVAPIIVEPDLDVPGISARHWNRPIPRANLKET